MRRKGIVSGCSRVSKHSTNSTKQTENAYIGELSGRPITFFRILYTTFLERCIGLPCGVVPRNLFSFLCAPLAPNDFAISDRKSQGHLKFKVAYNFAHLDDRWASIEEDSR